MIHRLRPSSLEGIEACPGRVPIHGASGITGYALVDIEDIPLVSLRRWHIDHGGYVWCHIRKENGAWTTAKLHRIIMNPPADMDVDHINGDRLDNRRSNLRVCTHGQNMMNHRGSGARSGFRGVRLTPKGRWSVRITHQRHEIHIGTFDDKADAIAARLEKERELRGEFAPC